MNVCKYIYIYIYTWKIFTVNPRYNSVFIQIFLYLFTKRPFPQLEAIKTVTHDNVIPSTHRVILLNRGSMPRKGTGRK